jgi:hypothetical protein
MHGTVIFSSHKTHCTGGRRTEADNGWYVSTALLYTLRCTVLPVLGLPVGLNGQNRSSHCALSLVVNAMISWVPRWTMLACWSAATGNTLKSVTIFFVVQGRGGYASFVTVTYDGAATSRESTRYFEHRSLLNSSIAEICPEYKGANRFTWS